MLRGTFPELHAAGCIQTGADVEANEVTARLRFGDMLRGLMFTSNGDPCHGCPAYERGQCPAFLQFNDRASLSQPKQRPFQKPAERCPQCRMKVRGPNHVNGWDHTHRVTS